MALAPPFMIPLLLFGGFFLNSDTIPVWLSWIQYISWFHYANEALTINQWDGVTDIDCEVESMVRQLNLPMYCRYHFCVHFFTPIRRSSPWTALAPTFLSAATTAPTT